MKTIKLIAIFVGIASALMLGCRSPDEGTVCNEINHQIYIMEYSTAEATATNYLANYPDSPQVRQCLAKVKAIEKENEREYYDYLHRQEDEELRSAKPPPQPYIPQIEVGMTDEMVRAELRKSVPPLSIESTARDQFSAVTVFVQYVDDSSGFISLTFDKTIGKVASVSYSGFDWVAWENGRPMPR